MARARVAGRAAGPVAVRSLKAATLSRFPRPEEIRLLSAIRLHVRHHDRFYGAAVVGLVVFASTGWWATALRLVMAGDAFFAVYLLSTAVLALHATAEDLRARARYQDEGIHLIVVLTLAAISLSLASLFYLVNENGPVSFRILFPILSVPLGWLTLHTITAFHYANVYYAEAPPRPGAPRDAGGLVFPGTPEPTLLDFLYHSFIVGMTSQVADVQVQSPSMRRLVLAHGITSFFMNTVLVALAVNVAASYAR